MTIERLYQFTAETNSNNDTLFVTGSSPNVTTSTPRSGLRSYNAAGAPRFFSAHLDPVAGCRLGHYWYPSGAPGSNGSNSPYFCYFADRAAFGRTSSVGIWARWYYRERKVALVRWSSTIVGEVERLYETDEPIELHRQDSWMHLGFCLDIDQGYFAGYINGRRFMNYSGDVSPYGFIDSMHTYGENVSFICGMGEPSGGAHFWGSCHLDDLYIDRYEDEEPAPPPMYRFRHMLPNATGANAEFSPEPAVPNWQNVDEIPPNAIDYNMASVNGLRDTFNFTNVINNYTYKPDEVITAAIPYATAYKNGLPGNPQVRVHAYDGTNYSHGPDRLLGIDHSAITRFARFPTKPDGSGWNQTDLHAMQFGYESRGVYL